MQRMCEKKRSQVSVHRPLTLVNAVVKVMMNVIKHELICFTAWRKELGECHT